MGLVNKNGIMVINIQVNLKMINSMEMEFTFWQKSFVNMQVNGKMIRYMGKENTLGKMEEIMMVSGKIII